MAFTTFLFLSTAGLLGGLVNAMAGGATLITFPAMIAAGLPPTVANASNAVAISPGHLIAAFADRGQLSASPRLLLLVLVALAGGAAGAVVLLFIPEDVFTIPVPGLIAFATLLFAFAPTIRLRMTGLKGGRMPAMPTAALLGAASFYGGFFGAGLGVILTAVMSITDHEEIRAIKASKNLLATCVALAATVIFITRGVVRWPETLSMLSGALAGGYAGGYLIRIVPARYVRWSVIAAGAAMTLIYVRLYWFKH